jgi:hypothetical protein
MSDEKQPLGYVVYNVRKFVFAKPDDMWSDGWYTWVHSTTDRHDAERVFAELKALGEYVEITERRVSEKRIARSHETMPESF